MTDPKWRVHVANLIQEILLNPGTSMLSKPLSIMARLLVAVGERAAQLDDPELNRLMVQLTIYEIADPHGPAYDPEKVRALLYR